MMMKNSRPAWIDYQIGSGVIAFSTTRHGGCSEGNYAAFNINRYCGDSEMHIGMNRMLLCRQLHIDERHLVVPHQVHADVVRAVDADYPLLADEERLQLVEGVDAVMTNASGLCVGVSTADCIPVLLHDGEHHAVCAVHAGWRGTVARIVVKAVEAMGRAYATRPEHVAAVVGPGISRACFEVGDEVYRQFAEVGFDMAPISEHREKWHIDLPECNRRQLLDVGVPDGQIHLSGICTYTRFNDFFSARRMGIDSGRIYNGIMLL